MNRPGMKCHLKRWFIVISAAICGSMLVLLSPLNPQTQPSRDPWKPSRSLWQAPMEFLRSKIVNTDSFDMASLKRLYKQRRDNASAECRAHPVKSIGLDKNIYTTNMFYDPTVNSLYCAVPKIGSSLWKRVFYVAHSNKTNDPLSMSGIMIHTDKKLKDLSLARFPREKRQDVADKAFSFMFARNPFHRIFSAYCDKVFMLAYETSKIVKTIREKTLRKRQGQKGPTGGGGKNTPFLYTGREFNITFGEILDYAAYSMDPHFIRISKQCDPCAMNFTVLGRMETFDADSRYVLDKLNRSHVLQDKMEDDVFKDSRDKGTIQDLLQRVSSILSATGGSSVSGGTTKFKALVRTWKVFHIRGFIRDDIAFPLSVADTKNVTMSHIVELAVQALELSGPPAKRLAQRDKYYQQAFRSVPLATIRRFSQFMKPDCRLFGYNCYPEEIYKDRREGDEELNVFSSDSYLYKELM